MLALRQYLNAWQHFTNTNLTLSKLTLQIDLCMKNIIYFIIFFSCISACKKEEGVNPSVKALTGVWKGNYSSPPDMPNEELLQAWELKENREIIVHDARQTPDAPAANRAVGTWSINGNIFTATYIFQTINVNRSLQGMFQNDNKIIKGTRGTNGSSTGNGTFTMTKE